MKTWLLFFGSILLCCGIDVRRLKYLRFLPRYLWQYKEYKKLGGVISSPRAIFSDFNESAGTAKGHYFHQDLLVASYIFQKNPKTHIDIGSRIDGFVAHVASFRPIKVLDIRALPITGHKNIEFIRANLMNPELHLEAVDSLSCLHAIEHFGLGRYGDPLDPNGHIKGFRNILKLLTTSGTLYISFPISSNPKTQFNEQRIFGVKEILEWVPEQPFIITNFDYVDDAGNLHQNVDLNKFNDPLKNGCGIYTIQKII